MLLPFTYPWIIRHHFSKNKTILDLGAGDGSFMKSVNFDKKYEIVGIELFDPYIKKAKKTKVYKEVIKGDVTRLENLKKGYDLVHASQVIEHLTKKDAKKFLEQCERLSTLSIVIGTPNGHFHQEEYDDNAHQEHKSAWSVKDFRKLRYNVYGQGWKMVYGEDGLMHTSFGRNKLIRKMLFIFSYCLSPFIYFHPEYAAHIIAIKKK